MLKEDNVNVIRNLFKAFISVCEVLQGKRMNIVVSGVTVWSNVKEWRERYVENLMVE